MYRIAGGDTGLPNAQRHLFLRALSLTAQKLEDFDSSYGVSDFDDLLPLEKAQAVYLVALSNLRAICVSIVAAHYQAAIAAVYHQVERAVMEEIEGGTRITPSWRRLVLDAVLELDKPPVLLPQETSSDRPTWNILIESLSASVPQFGADPAVGDALAEDPAAVYVNALWGLISESERSAVADKP